MDFYLALRTHPAAEGAAEHVSGWPEAGTWPLAETAKITLGNGVAPARAWLQLGVDPAAGLMTVTAANGGLHYFRLADATLRPLPAEAKLALARGDAYVAVSPGALRLADSPAMARYLHLRDSFNAERLAEGLLGFLAQESSQVEFPETITVIVVEAR